MPATLLIITDDRLMRADIGRTIEVADAPRSAWALPAAVEAALALAARRPQRTWVIATQAWTGRVELPAAAVSGLDGDQLAAAIAYEAEPISGIPAGEAAVASRPMGGSQWATIVARADRNAVAAAVRAAGGKLVGIAHPLGLSSTSDGLTVIERWGDTLARRDASTHPDGLHIELAADDAVAMSTIDDWSADGPALLVAERPLMNRVGIDQRTLDEPASRQRLIEDWHANLQAARVPTIAPPATPTPRWQPIAVAAALALLAAVGCWWHQHAVASELAAMREVLAQREPAPQQVAFEQDIAALSARRDALLAALDALPAPAASPRELQAHRERFAALMETLAREHRDGVVLDAIATTNGAVQLSARAVDVASADDWAAALRARLAPVGWRVEPARKQAERRGATAVWAVELTLIPEATTATVPRSSRVASRPPRTGGDDDD